MLPFVRISDYPELSYITWDTSIDVIDIHRAWQTYDKRFSYISIDLMKRHELELIKLLQIIYGEFL
jgi:hypothetical protein